MARITKQKRAELFWRRVYHVRANPLDITHDEIRDYSFLCGLINIPKYSPDPDAIWRRGGRNGRYTVEFHSHHKRASRSGKTHYYSNWFDVLDHDTGGTFQVSHQRNSKGKSILEGYNKNIFEAQEEAE